MKSDEHLFANDPRYIEGVYNYCDRWCDRCPLAHRCRTHTSSVETEQELAEKEARNAEFWRGLESILGPTLERVEHEPPEFPEALAGGPLPPEESPQEEFERHRGTPLAAESLRYAERAHAWFASSRPLLERRQRELAEAAGTESEAAIAEAVRIADALEVIQWHLFPIHVKLMRAQPRLFERRGIDEPEELQDLEDLDDVDWEEGELFEPASIDPVQNDSNGSAKVALIAMDRSIAAWGILWESLGDESGEILALLVDLAQLRRDAEREFPNARAFIRPGFDTMGL